MRQSLAGYGLAFDLTTALDAALDEIAHRKAHVGLEGIDSGGMQPIPQPWNVRGRLCGNQNNRSRVESFPGDRFRLDGTQAARPPRICRANKKMRTLAIIPHQKRPAAGQRSVNMDHGPARTCAERLDAIAGL